ncbi:Methionine synthase [Desulfarculales bacterium]
MPDPFAPYFTATGIGTLPFMDPREAVDAVCDRLTAMPYWPQLPQRTAIEDMNLQYARALTPLVATNLEERHLVAHPGLSREEALAAFYERLLAGPEEGFGLLPDEAAGFFVFRERVAAAGAGQYPWLKGHVTGPLTLAASVLGSDGKALLYDDEMAEAIAKGLGLAAAAQARQLAPFGRPLMIFFDEPFLSGYGSAFSPVNREKVIALLSLAAQETRQRMPAVLGVHCCGNTDWGMLVESGLDVLNLDSAGFGEHLLLYPEALKKLFARGGAVAWGAVPTIGYTGEETAQDLWAGLRGLLDKLVAQGFDPATLARQALVTPACGLGSLSQDKALAILDLTRQVAKLARAEFAI